MRQIVSYGAGTNSTAIAGLGIPVNEDKLLVSFSGGLTSGKLAHDLRSVFATTYKVRFVFANTAPNNERTAMRMWIDTEFNEYHGALISLALVAEDGREWYGVRYCDDPGWWVREHVIPHLLQQPERDTDLREGLSGFLGQFDAVHIISDWPGDIAHFCNFLEFAPGDRIGPDTMTFEVRRDLPDTATTSAIPHNALEDARALAKIEMVSNV